MKERVGGLLRPNPTTKTAEDLPYVLPAEYRFENDKLLTEEEAGEILRVTNKQWFYDHTTRLAPIVPHISMGRKKLYPEKALYAWIAENTETRTSKQRKAAAKIEAHRQRYPNARKVDDA